MQDGSFSSVTAINITYQTNRGFSGKRERGRVRERERGREGEGEGEREGENTIQV